MILSYSQFTRYYSSRTSRPRSIPVKMWGSASSWRTCRILPFNKSALHISPDAAHHVCPSYRIPSTSKHLFSEDSGDRIDTTGYSRRRKDDSHNANRVLNDNSIDAPAASHTTVHCRKTILLSDAQTRIWTCVGRYFCLAGDPDTMEIGIIVKAVDISQDT